MIGGFPVPRTLLVIAPHSDLQVGTDIAAAVSGELDTDGGILTGDVSVARVTDAAQRRRWDMMYFGGHAGDEGWQLSDGEVLDINTMLSIAEIAGTRWIFLNGCETVWPGYQLMSNGVDAICVFRSPKDNVAGMMARSFFHHIKSSKDPWQAYILSRPRYGNVAYLYLPGRGLAVREKLEKIENHLSDMDRKMERFMTLMERVSALEKSNEDSKRRRWYENSWLIVGVNTLLMLGFLLMSSGG